MMVTPRCKSTPISRCADSPSHSCRTYDMPDATGLQFVVTTPLHAVDRHDRRLIKGHATRARKKQRRVSDMRSWISPDRELGSLKPANGDPATSIPKRAGSDFSGLQLPSGIEPWMIQELMIRKHSPPSDPCQLTVKRLTDGLQ